MAGRTPRSAPETPRCGQTAATWCTSRARSRQPGAVPIRSCCLRLSAPRIRSGFRSTCAMAPTDGWPSQRTALSPWRRKRTSAMPSASPRWRAQCSTCDLPTSDARCSSRRHSGRSDRSMSMREDVMRDLSNFRNAILHCVLAIAAAAILCAAAPGSAAPQYKLKLLHAFCKLQGCTDGELPAGALLRDSGNLYGATLIGGKYGDGVVFKLAPNGTKWTEYVLHNFCKDPNTCKDYFPVGDLIMDKNGVLYGVAGNCGGFAGSGSIFSLTRGAKDWGLRVLHSFPNGEYICSGLAYKGLESGARWDGTSPLFGVTDSGGKYGNGYVYELKPSGWTYTDIH